MNPKREFFGVERLRTSLSWMPQEVGPTELVKRLRDDVSRFASGAELADDITLVALRWEGGSPALANVDLDAAVARL
jgi:serine phosphatase RsbU (regulator of sigma subunit)